MLGTQQVLTDGPDDLTGCRFFLDAAVDTDRPAMRDVVAAHVVIAGWAMFAAYAVLCAGHATLASAADQHPCQEELARFGAKARCGQPLPVSTTVFVHCILLTTQTLLDSIPQLAGDQGRNVLLPNHDKPVRFRTAFGFTLAVAFNQLAF